MAISLDEAFEKLRAADEPVPAPLRLPTADEVESAEQAIGIRFHPDYRRFQLEFSNVNVGLLEPANVLPGMLPYADLRQVVSKARKLGVPKDLLPFCEDNGNYFFLDAAGAVGYWDHDDQSANIRYESLAEWIVREWLDDEFMR